MRRILHLATALLVGIVAAFSSSVVPAGTSLTNADSLPVAAAATGCNFGDCTSATPTSIQTQTATTSALTSSSSVTSADPSVIGITDPTQISPQIVYDFSANAADTNPTAFPGGSFSENGQIAIVGYSWATWNPQDNGKHVLFATGNSFSVVFATPQQGVAVKAEPNVFAYFDITIQAFDSGHNSLGSYTRSINGYAGAAYLGLLSSSPTIASVTLSSDPAAGGFAFSDLTYGATLAGGSCSTTGVGIGPIPFPSLFRLTLVSDDEFGTTRWTYENALQGNICPETPWSFGYGTDPLNLNSDPTPLITIRSTAGAETSVTKKGDFETKLPIVKGLPQLYTGGSTTPPGLKIGFTNNYKTGTTDFNLTDEVRNEIARSIKIPTTSIKYLVAVARTGAIAIGFIVALGITVGTDVVGAINGLFLLYQGPSPKPVITTAVSTAASEPMRTGSAPVGVSLPSDVISDLTAVYGPELIDDSTVGSLTVDKEIKGPGQDVTYAGTNFVPGGLVYLSLAIPSNPSSAIETQIRADGNGVINGKIRLPANAQPGQWLLSAVDISEMYTALQDFVNGGSNTLRFYLVANEVTVPNYIRVPIDIKPSDPITANNPINLRSNGVTPVAILTTPTFDATTVNPLSVRFGPSGASAVHSSVDDVNGDNRTDLVLQFNTQQVGVTLGDTQACLIGQTTSGAYIVGCDTIVIVPPSQ